MRCYLETKNFSMVYDRKDNSYDELRFLLALMVLYVHSYALLYGEKIADPFTKIANFQVGLGSLSVYGFFVLSGFFMIQSLESNNSIKIYFKNRVLRIIPAFWMSLLLSSFVIVPLLANVFDVKSALDFTVKSGFFHAFGYAWTINGAFPFNPIVDGINGSMWTLKHEIGLYMLLPLFVYLTHNSRRLLLIMFSIFFILSVANITTKFTLFNIPCCMAWIFSINEYPSFIYFSTYFFAGVIFYKYRENIIVSKRIWLILLIFFLLAIFFGNLKIISLFTLPYLILVAGATIKKRFFSSKGDYSYGMYIYAFPIQQVVVHLYKNELNVWSFFALSSCITLCISIVSWHYFEKRILKLKNKSI